MHPYEPGRPAVGLPINATPQPSHSSGQSGAVHPPISQRARTLRQLHCALAHRVAALALPLEVGHG